jgi:Disulfide bond formation protein DsbB
MDIFIGDKGRHRPRAAGVKVKNPRAGGELLIGGRSSMGKMASSSPGHPEGLFVATAPLPPREVPRSTAAGTLLTAVAALVSLAALAGSLYLSIGMGLKACPLCFYQRTFIMGAAGVLCVGLFLPGVRRSALCALALPAAVGGLVIAIFHTYLEATGFLECPLGVLDFGSAPQQSLAAHVLLVLLLVAGLFADGARRPADLVVGAGAIVLGLLFALGGIRSTPPSPQPKAPYEMPLDQDGCRRPYAG